MLTTIAFWLCVFLYAALELSIPMSAQMPSVQPSPAPIIPHVSTKQQLSARQPLSFIENKGQWASEVRYMARLSGMNVWLTDSGFVYDFHRRNEDSSLSGHVVRMKFAGGKEYGGKQHIPVRGEDKQTAYYNYFLGNDRSKWASNVPLYGAVRLEEVYTGIAARAYFEDGQMRYDMIVAPNADASQIALEFDGADGVRVNSDGDLVLQTSVGEVVQGKLYAYQVRNGRREQVACRFSAKQQNVAFALGAYDPALPLVIDPLVWGTYIGGSASDLAQSATMDANGHIYIVGASASANFPTSAGAYDAMPTGSNDAIVTKLSSNGALIFSTFLGGNGTESESRICLDNSGNVYAVGLTTSTNFPMESPYDGTFNGGGEDFYIAKLTSDGTNLLYSTYFGGSDAEDYTAQPFVDAAGMIYFGGRTYSNNYPTTGGAYRTIYVSGYDGVITKLNPSLGASGLVYSTYISTAGLDHVSSIVVPPSSNLIYFGGTLGGGGLATANAFDQTYNGGLDICVGILNPLGGGTSDMQYLSYVGGSGNEANALARYDVQTGFFYLVTGSSSVNFPTTANAFQTTRIGSEDAAIAVINPAVVGTAALVYGTYIGGSGGTNQQAQYVARGRDGRLYIVGYTDSPSFPTTPGAMQLQKRENGDIFVSVINPTRSGLASLEYSTFIGTAASDSPVQAAFTDAAGNIILVSGGSLQGLPTSVGATFNGGTADIAALKIAPTPEYPLRTAFGSSIEFDGTQRIQTQTSFPRPLQWTVECWVRSPEAPSGTKTTYPFTHGSNPGIAIVWDHTNPAFRGAAQVLLADGVTFIPAKFGNLQGNTWYHLAATFDGRTLRAYQDGILTSQHSIPSALQPNTTPVIMGFGASPLLRFRGTIDEARYWNTALPATTIARFAGQEIDPTHPNWSNLIGYWNFNTYEGLVATDISPNKNGATLLGMYGDASVPAEQGYSLMASPRSPSNLAPRILPSIGQLSSPFPVNLLLQGANGGSPLASITVNGQTLQYTPRTGAVQQGFTDRVSYRLAQERDTINASIQVRFLPELSTQTAYALPNTAITLDATVYRIWGGAEPFRYEWAALSGASDSALSSTTASAPVVVVSTNATFRLTITDVLNFTASTTISVNVSGPYYYLSGDAATRNAWSTDPTRPVFPPLSMDAPAQFIIGASKLATLQSPWTLNSRATLIIQRVGALNVSNSGRLENGGAVIVQDGGRLQITDAGAITGRSIRFEGSSTLEYTGTSPKVTTDAELPPFVSSGSVTILNTGGVRLNGSKNLTVPFSILSGGVVMVSNATLRLGGACTLQGRFTTDSLSHLIVEGNGAVTGTLNIRSGVLGGLELNRPSLRLALTSPLRLIQHLTLRTGLLLANATQPLTLNEQAVVSGGNNTSFVEGVVRRPVPSMVSTTSTLIFPIGIGASYLPLTLSAPRTVGATIMEATIVSAVAQGVNNGGLDSSVKQLFLFPAWGLSTVQGTFVSAGLRLGTPVQIPPNAGLVSLPSPSAPNWSAVEGVYSLQTGSTSSSISLARLTRTGIFSLGELAPPPLPPATITAFTPSTGNATTLLTIQGRSFINIRAVRVGGKLVESFTVQGTTAVLAVLGRFAESGAITIETSTNGTARSEGVPFLVAAPPLVTSATPSILSRGQSLVIQGVNFAPRLQETSQGISTGTVELPPLVSIGSISAATVRLESPTQVTAIFSEYTRGTVSVQTRFGTGVSVDSVTIADAPSLTSVVPLRIGSGGMLTVQGAYLLGTREVRIGSQSVEFIQLSPEQVLVRVPANILTNTSASQSELLRLTTPLGTAVFPRSVEIIPSPEITAITPLVGSAGSVGSVGSVVEVRGRHLQYTQQVRFHLGSTASVEAYFRVQNESGTLLHAIIPADAVPLFSLGTTAGISVRTIGGEASTMPMIQPLPVTLPTITGFSERAVLEGRQIQIWGVNIPTQSGLPQASSLRLAFGGIMVTNATVLSSTRITCTVPFGVVSASYRSTEAICVLETRMNAAQDTAQNIVPLTTFSRLPIFVQARDLPFMQDFTPRLGGARTELTITGANLGKAPRGAVRNVWIGGKRVESFVVESPEQMRVRVGRLDTSAFDGEVVLETASGLVSTIGTFRFLPNAPAPYIPVAQADSLALVDVYRAFGGANWQSNTTGTWLRSMAAEWAGVSVAGGRVVGLSLANNQIVGVITTVDTLGIFQRLSALRTLDLSGNTLRGELPQSLALMPFLEDVRLNNNQISGTLGSVQGIHTLRRLNLSNNALSGTLSALCGLPLLEQVALSGNAFSGTLPPCVLALPTLTVFNASNNQLSGALPITIDTVAMPSNLETLNLRGNRFTGTLPVAWGRDGGVGGALAFAKNTSSQTQSLSGVQYLDLGENQLSGTIPPEWGDLAALRLLALDGNSLSGRVPDEITNLSRLRSLQLQNNALTHLPDLTRIARLDTVRVEGNYLEFDDIEPNLFLTRRVNAFRYAPQKPLGIMVSTTATLDMPFVWNVTVRGRAGEVEYQWQKNDAPFGLPSTQGTLLLETVQPTDTGRYWVKMRSSRVPNLVLESSPLLVSTTVLPSIPTDAPTLLSPPANAQDTPLRPTFMWSQQALARYFDVEYSTSATFDTGVLRLEIEPSYEERVRPRVVTDPQRLSAPLQPLQRYFWRVRARNIAGAGAWSSTGSFSTVNANVFVSVERLDFGLVSLHDTARQQLLLRNTSDRKITIDRVTTTNPLFVAETIPQQGLVLSAGEEARINIAFMPLSVGVFQTDLVMTTTIGDLQDSIPVTRRVSGRGVALKIIPPNFDTVVVNVPRVASALLVNRGREAITVGKVMLLADSSIFSDQSRNLAFSPLTPNDTLAVVLSCRAQDIGRLPSARVLVVLDSPNARGDTVSIVIQGFARLPQPSDVSARLGIRAVPPKVSPGGAVTLELFISKGEIERLRRFNVPTISATFSLNPQVITLSPQERFVRRASSAAVGVSKQIRYIVPPTAWDGVQSVLKRVECLAVAGDTDQTELTLESVRWDGVQIEGLENGTFIAEVCEAGGKRLVTSAKATQLAVIAPNPAKDEISIAYTLREDGVVEIALVDVSGKTAQVLVAEEQAAGEYTVTKALKNVPSGSYTVQLRMSTGVVTKRVNVVR
jgi:Leucine-rich repeat (LRR) protein